MNERTKALIDETANLMPGVFTIEYESGKKGVEFSEDALSKFVELFIGESIQVMISNDYHGQWLGEKIKEHFGVEE
jgi:hypothetical protein